MLLHNNTLCSSYGGTNFCSIVCIPTCQFTHHCLLRMCTTQGIETHLWAADLPFPIVGCISESDAGLQTAERLQADLCSNSGGINRARRDKFLMNEALKAAGMLQ
jgi:hypothetical protein